MQMTQCLRHVMQHRYSSFKFCFNFVHHSVVCHLEIFFIQLHCLVAPPLFCYLSKAVKSMHEGTRSVHHLQGEDTTLLTLFILHSGVHMYGIWMHMHHWFVLKHITIPFINLESFILLWAWSHFFISSSVSFASHDSLLLWFTQMTHFDHTLYMSFSFCRNGRNDNKLTTFFLLLLKLLFSRYHK